jgi:acyl carrier protein
MDEVELKVKKIISKQLGIDIKNIQPNMKFVEDLGGDSLDTVEMLLSVEDEFGLEIDEEVAETIETVQMVIDYIKSLQKTQ